MVEWVFNSALSTQHPALPLKFVPTRYEKSPGGFWMFSITAIQNVVSEYAKMVWFFTTDKLCNYASLTPMVPCAIIVSNPE